MALSPNTLSLIGGVGQGLAEQNAAQIERLKAIYGYMGQQNRGMGAADINAQQRDETAALNDQIREDIAQGIDQTRLQASPYAQGANGVPISPLTQSMTNLNNQHAAFFQSLPQDAQQKVYLSLINQLRSVDPQTQQNIAQNFDQQYGTNISQNFTDKSGNWIPIVDPNSAARIGLMNAQANNQNASANSTTDLVNPKIQLLANQAGYLGARTQGQDLTNQYMPALDNSLMGLRADQGQADLMGGQGRLDSGNAALQNSGTNARRLNDLAPLYAAEAGVSQARMGQLLNKDPDFASNVQEFDNVNTNITNLQNAYAAALQNGDAEASSGLLDQLKYLNGMRADLAGQLKARATQNSNNGAQGSAIAPPNGFVQKQSNGATYFVNPQTKQYWYNGQIVPASQLGG